METSTESRPDLMAGKKILYVHGFGSSGASGTVKGLRILLPKAQVIAPDLPIHPAEAMELLHGVCDSEHPDLIIGTSMGGMYAEMLYGTDRILINPAFQIADTMVSHNMMGRQEFHNPRQDGQKDFLVNKQLIAEYREVSSGNFANADSMDEQQHVYGLFGTRDTLVHTFDLFSLHYGNAIRFDGEHYLNDHALIHAVMPVIQWIDDRQQHRERPVLHIGLDNTLADCRNGWRHISEADRAQYSGHEHDAPSFFRNLEPTATAVKAFHTLAQHYDVHILADAPYNRPDIWADKVWWTERWLGVPAYGRITLTQHKNLVYGDYLIDACPERCGASDFMGTLLHFGEDPYKTWEDLMTFFERLGWQ